MIAEYLTWKVIKPVLVKFGPWIAVALLLLGIYVAGRYHGAAKWEGKYATAVTERNTARETATHNADEVVKLTDAIDRQNAAIRQMEARQSEHLDAVNEAHAKALERQATSYQRAVDAARASASDLQCRVEVMTVAEACHAAWMEVAK